MHVQLDPVRPLLQRAPEGGQGVLRVIGGSAAVRRHLRGTQVFDFQGKMAALASVYGVARLRQGNRQQKQAQDAEPFAMGSVLFNAQIRQSVFLRRSFLIQGADQGKLQRHRGDAHGQQRQR